MVNKDSKRLISKAKEAERRRLGQALEREEGRGRLFKIVKQRVRRNGDGGGVGCVKDKDGMIVVDGKG